jgi:hypothetical protein
MAVTANQLKIIQHTFFQGSFRLNAKGISEITKGPQKGQWAGYANLAPNVQTRKLFPDENSARTYRVTLIDKIMDANADLRNKRAGNGTIDPNFPNVTVEDGKMLVDIVEWDAMLNKMVSDAEMTAIHAKYRKSKV